MNFACDKCQRRYSIADDKVRGRTVKIRCKNCQNVITVQGPSEERTGMMSIADVEKLRAQKAPPTAPKNPWDNEATRAAPALDLTIEWFAMVKAKQTGPLNIRALNEKVSSGDLTLRSYLWRKGMADWKRAADLPELSILFSSAPPAPAQAPAPGLVARPRTGVHPAASPNGQAVPPPAPPKTGAFPTLTAKPAPAAAPQDAPWGPAEPAAPSNGSPGTAGGLEQLFFDGDTPDASTESHQAVGVAAPSVQAEGAETFEARSTGKKKRKEKEKETEEDPFKAFGAIIDPAKLPPPGESTSFFIAQAGVNKRNPAWKIATFVVLLIAVPVAVLYALSTLKVVPLEVTRVDESGNEVKESVFSAEGVSGLKDMLLGRKKKAVEKAASPAVRPAAPKGSTGQTGPSSVGTVATAELPKGMSNADVKRFYGDQSKGDVGPRVRGGAAPEAHDGAAGLTAEQIQKVFNQGASAFQNCIEQELRRNPNFKGGKVFLNATIASSGVVKHVEIDRADLNRSDVGTCIKDRAKRMVFPSFTGEEFEAQIPLFMGVTM